MDIDFDVDTGRFCLRAAGIFRHADKILFQRKIGDERWALPGGKIIYGESSNEAIEREFVEPPTALLRHQHPMPLGQGLKQFLDDALHKSKMGAGQLKGFLFERLEAAKF